jgi:hypothetical protein
MRQMALALGEIAGRAPPRVVIGNANAGAVEAFGRAESWPFHTAILTGPERAGKSLLASWFEETGHGDAIDDADRIDETAVFHAWNRAQASGRPLLLVASEHEAGWRPSLPDLGSRLGAALRLAIGTPDDAMLGELIALHAELRGFALDDAALAYLVPRCERSHLGAERLVEAIDRLSLERKSAPTLSIWREALEELTGGTRSEDREPRLF